jgi:hypothetical protein
MFDLAIPAPSLSQAPSETAAAGPRPDHHSPFHTLLSELNPLQYLPMIGTIYRAMTGDTIPETVRSVGSFVVSGIIGGPIGLATNAALLAIEKVTGIDPEKIGQNLLAGLGIGHHDAGLGVALATQSIAALTPSAPVAWSTAQLTAYGVTTTAGGVMQRGVLKGADVLNDLELTRQGMVVAARIVA